MKDEVLKLAKECGATTYTNRHYPEATAVTFSPVAWEKFCEQALAAPVQEPVAWIWKYANGEEEVVFAPPRHVDASYVDAPSTITPLYTTPPAAQRQWVGLTDAEVMQTMSGDWTSQFYFARAIEAKLKEKNDAAQPAVPDALNPKDENPAYAAGWNDCRAEMLRGMKPCETR